MLDRPAARLLLSAALLGVPCLLLAQEPPVIIQLGEPPAAASADPSSRLLEPFLEAALPAGATGFRLHEEFLEAALYEAGTLRLWRCDFSTGTELPEPAAFTLQDAATLPAQARVHGLAGGWMLVPPQGDWLFVSNEALSPVGAENPAATRLASPGFAPRDLHAADGAVVAIDVKGSNLSLAVTPWPADAAAWWTPPALDVPGADPAVLAFGKLLVVTGGASPEPGKAPESPWVWTFPLDDPEGEWARSIFPLVPGPGAARGASLGGQIAAVLPVDHPDGRSISGVVAGFARPRARGGLASWTTAPLPAPLPADVLLFSDPKGQVLLAVEGPGSGAPRLSVYHTPLSVDTGASREAAAQERRATVERSYLRHAAALEEASARGRRVALLLVGEDEESRRARESVLLSSDAKAMMRDLVMASESGPEAAALREQFGIAEDAPWPVLAVLSPDGEVVLLREGPLDRAALAEFLKPLWAPVE